MSIPAAQLEEHRTAVTGHCYRMMGSAVDADDAVQETMVRAWRSLDRFDGRSSLRRWLYQIATNVCLDALSDRSRRERPMEAGPRLRSPKVSKPRLPRSTAPFSARGQHWPTATSAMHALTCPRRSRLCFV